jgi:hypothetical protein
MRFQMILIGVAVFVAVCVSVFSNWIISFLDSELEEPHESPARATSSRYVGALS